MHVSARQPATLRTAGSATATLLDRYIKAAVLRAFLLVAAALTALFSLLEFVEQLSSVGQGHYRLIDALIFVLLTAPSRLLQVTPVSMLLGCLLALGALGRNSELTALRSLGVSEGRMVGSVLKLVVPVIVALFLMAEFIIPPAQQLAHDRRTSALSPSAPLQSGDGFWAQSDHQYLNVQRFEHGDVPKNIDIYTFSPDGKLESLIHADSGDIRLDGTWLLTGVSKKDVYEGQFQTKTVASFAWHSFISRQEAELLMLPPDTMPPIALYRYVRELEQRHQQAIRYEQELWAKASIPLSLVAMIMIAAPFIFGPPRAQNTGQQLTIGAIFGIVFSLSQQIVGHLDLLLDLSPAVAALAPPLLFIALAVYLFRNAHRPRSRPFIPPSRCP